MRDALVSYTPRIVQLGLYVHPFAFGDLEQLGGPRGLVELGYEEIAIAAAYHAGRWLVPARDDGIVRFLEDGVVHAKLAPATGTLAPLTSSLVGASSPLADTCAAARSAGLRTAAWTVLFHNTRLGARHPESCVTNAFGEPYEYALCPARPEVRGYGLGLLAQLATTPGLETLELEAAGWMGHKHGSHHDKSSFAGDEAADFLLSYCFCTVCSQALSVLGCDPVATRALFRESLRARFHAADALSEAVGKRDDLVATLGKATLAALLEARRRGNEEFLRAVRAALPRPVRIALHVQPDPFFTGSQMGIEIERVGPLVDELVVTCYGEGATRIRSRLAELRPPVGASLRLAIWPKAPHFRGENDLLEVRDAARQLGCSGIRIYHASLLPRTTLRRVATAMRAARM